MRFSWNVLPFIDVSEIDRRIRSLKSMRAKEKDRKKRKKIEVDICYFQRERKIRQRRRQAHEEFLKKNKKT